MDFIGRQQGYSEAYRLPDYVPESSGGESSSLGSESGAPVRYDTLFADIARAAVSQGQISTCLLYTSRRGGGMWIGGFGGGHGSGGGFGGGFGGGSFGGGGAGSRW